MLEPSELVERLTSNLSAQADSRSLNGKRVVITAGGTREAIDPVRFISNRSSGRMGYALAEAARDAGAEVVLISGMTAMPKPPGITRIEVESAAFHGRVQTAYERIISEDKRRFLVVDGEQPIDRVAADVLDAVLLRLEPEIEA